MSFNLLVRQLAWTAILALGLVLMAAGSAWADGCPGADQTDGVDPSCEVAQPTAMSPQSDDNTVPAVDDSGAQIPYVEEITAPPDGTALTF